VIFTQRLEWTRSFNKRGKVALAQYQPFRSAVSVVDLFHDRVTGTFDDAVGGRVAVATQVTLTSLIKMNRLEDDH